MAPKTTNPPVKRFGNLTPKEASLYTHLRTAVALPGAALVAVGLLLIVLPSLLTAAQVIGLALLSLGSAVVAEEFSKAFERRDRLGEVKEERQRFEAISRELKAAKALELEASNKIQELTAQLGKSRMEMVPILRESVARQERHCNEEANAILAGMLLGYVFEGELRIASPGYSALFPKSGQVHAWSRHENSDRWLPFPTGGFLIACKRLNLLLDPAVYEKLDALDRNDAEENVHLSPKDQHDRIVWNVNLYVSISHMLQPEIGEAFELGWEIASMVQSLDPLWQEATFRSIILPIYHFKLIPDELGRPENIVVPWVKTQIRSILPDLERIVEQQRTISWQEVTRLRLHAFEVLFRTVESLPLEGKFEPPA